MVVATALPATIKALLLPAIIKALLLPTAHPITIPALRKMNRSHGSH